MAAQKTRFALLNYKFFVDLNTEGHFKERVWQN